MVRSLRFLVWRLRVALGLNFALVAGSGALLAQTIPSGGVSLVAEADMAVTGSFYSTATPAGTVAARTIVPVPGQSFTQAARVDVQNPTGDFWSSAITSPSNRAVSNGDVILIHFFMRAERSTDETGTVFAQVYAEGPGPDYRKSISRQVNAASEWMEFFLPFVVDGNYAAGQLGLKIGFGAGNRPRVVDVAGVRVLWYGKTRTLEEMPRTAFTYDGRAPDAAWRTAADARIEQHRKANYGVRVVDAAGQPVSGASVRVRLRRHAFPFGTAFVGSRVVNPANAADQMYRQKLVELFNAGSPENDLKWPPWIGEWGSGFARAQTVAALDWLRARDFHLRGHVLVWPSERNLPNAMKPLTNSDTTRQRVLGHIADIVPATRDYLSEWDVLNEPYDNFDLMTLFGNGVMVDWFKEARKHQANAALYINEYGILSGGGVNETKQQFYEDTIRFLLQQGAPLDGIGMQGHFDSSPTGMNRVWTVLQRYATAFPQLAIKITEFDVDTEDEQLQADYTRDFLTMVFSHPAVAGFQVWGFWENAHWRDRAAMYRSDWTEKPNGRAFRELVHGLWRTDDTRVTDADGRISGRGFHGDYEVSASHATGSGSRSFTISATGGETTVTLAAGANRARLVNLATRGAVGTGANVMIAGFVVRGGDKDVVVRAVGPKLAQPPFNVPGVLADPRLQLLTADQIDRGFNDDWDDVAAASVGGLSLAASPSDAKSAALSRTLNPGGYTAQVSGAANGTGVALVEVYDVSPQASSRLINLATRGAVGTGANILIGGFRIEGEGTLRVLIRGVGPALVPTPFNVVGALADPMIQLLDASGERARNDDWAAGAQRAEIASTSSSVGAFPLAAESKDAALIADLEAGSYTVHLSGVGNTTGIGLIEVYAVE